MLIGAHQAKASSLLWIVLVLTSSQLFLLLSVIRRLRPRLLKV